MYLIGMVGKLVLSFDSTSQKPLRIGEMSDILPISSRVPLATDNGAAIGTLPPLAEVRSQRHSATVRATHWLTTLAFLALLVTGVEILISHPRFYWGETGNVRTTPLFKLPIPSSRSTVPTGYGYVLPDQNGWSRYLHFQSAWVVVLTGLLYVCFGFLTGHFRRNLFPARGDLKGGAVSRVIGQHLHLRPARAEEAWSYNILQRLSYLAVIF